LVQAGAAAEDRADPAARRTVIRRTVVLPTAAQAATADRRDKTVRATAVPADREDRRTVEMVQRTATVRREASPIVAREAPENSVRADPVVPVGVVGRDSGLAVRADSAAEAVARLDRSSHRRSSMN